MATNIVVCMYVFCGLHIFVADGGVYVSVVCEVQEGGGGVHICGCAFM